MNNQGYLILSKSFPLSKTKTLTIGLNPLNRFVTTVSFSKRNEFTNMTETIAFNVDDFLIIWKYLIRIIQTNFQNDTHNVSGTAYSICILPMFAEKNVIIYKTNDFLNQSLNLSEKNIQFVMQLEQSIQEQMDQSKLCEKQVLHLYNLSINKLGNLFQKNDGYEIKMKIAKNFLENFNSLSEHTRKSLVFDYELFIVEMSVHYFDYIFIDYIKLCCSR
uniref:Uncharacterized protein n=1 Tax=Cacopsylla melanoneura TaxID=428564 RepID=A0A8D8Z6A5_9HEMI